MARPTDTRQPNAEQLLPKIDKTELTAEELTRVSGGFTLRETFVSGNSLSGSHDGQEPPPPPPSK